jgi:putative chitinase
MEKKIKQLLKTIKLNESMLSLIFGIVTVLLVGILIFRVYNSNKPQITQNAEQTTEPSPTEKVGEVPVETKEDGQKYATNLPETYKVQKGDHLWAIAQKLYGSGYNWVDIAKENNLKNPGLLYTDQELKLPKVAVRDVTTPKTTVASKTDVNAATISGDSYKVVKGDNLWSIAVRAYGDGYKWPDIAKANDLKRPGHILVDQELKLPR